jgi:hypothetical protein
MTALEVLIKQIDEKIEQVKDFLSSGKAGTFEEYKRMCGEIRGLFTARSYAIDLKSNLENMDE